MEFKRIKFVALCLGMALLLVAGTAMAGTTFGPAGSTGFKFAREVGASNLVYTMPAGTVVRNMSVIRSIAQDFFVDVTLVGGATFATGRLPASADLVLTEVSGVTTYPAVIVSGGLNNGTTVRYFVDVAPVDMDTLGILTLTVTGWTIKDTTANVIGGGGNFQVSITTSDSATNVPFDSGNDAAVLMSGFYGTAAGPLTPTTAVIDVATNRKMFVPTPPDTTTIDFGATAGFDASVSGVLQANGTPYSLIAASRINLVIAGDLSGIVSFIWDPGALFGPSITHVVTSAERTAGAATIPIPGDFPSIVDIHAVPIETVITGTTQLTARTLTLTANLVLSGGLDGPAANNRTLLPTATLTTWTLNGTILVANFANGNNTAWLSRFYLWNPSTVDGVVTARVFTLPVIGQPNAPVGATVVLGTLAAGSGLNIRLAEDILTPGGVPLPYVTDGGNVVVEFTIEAINVSGFTQIFSPTAFMGVCNMTKVQ